MQSEELLQAIQTKITSAQTSQPEGQGKPPLVAVPAADFRKLAVWLKADEAMAFDYPMCQTAVDYPETNKIISVYHLYSSKHKHSIEIRVELDRKDPKVETVSDLWLGCNWFERETYDMFGIVFENHPDLRRIMLTDDWVGWPLRKDYKDSRIVPKPY